MATIRGRRALSSARALRRSPAPASSRARLPMQLQTPARQAARAIASGLPPSRRHTCATAGAFSGVTPKLGCTARARDKQLDSFIGHALIDWQVRMQVRPGQRWHADTCLAGNTQRLTAAGQDVQTRTAGMRNSAICAHASIRQTPHRTRVSTKLHLPL
jgi:hypothetical protein